MNIINLTPHTIKVMCDNKVIEFPSQGSARVNSVSKTVSEINGIPIKEIEYSDIIGLPDPQENTCFIVSMLVLQRKGTRTDLIAPNTDNTAIRENGQIVAVTSFVR